MKNKSITEWQLLLDADIKRTLRNAEIVITPIPNLPIKLFLLADTFPQDTLDANEFSAALNEPAYWCFCWGSGYAQAKWLYENPDYIKGKTVLDFGCGSGIGAVVAAQLGAKKAIACDIDPAALNASAANAALNNVEVELLDDFFKITEKIDLILAADVLYDKANHIFLDHFQQKAHDVLLADSRVKNLTWPGIEKFAEMEGITLPDLNEFDEFKRINFYRCNKY